MDPPYFGGTRLNGISFPDASQPSGPSPQEWYDMEAKSPSAVPFHEQVQVPSWNSELHSGRGRVSPVAPIWDIWRSSEEDAETGSKKSNSPPSCYLCSEHAGDSDSSESDSDTPSSDGTRRPSKDLQLRLVGLTLLAVLLLSAVVAVTANMNRVILGSLDTEPPDATGQGKPNCQTVVYTYCTVARREFHYRPSVNACLATSLDPVVQLCARGKNRFASLADCEHSCVLGEHPRDACFQTPLFTGCNREDVRDSWWFYDGGRCHLWSFPSGTCPSNGSAVFATAAECAGKCVGHRGRQGYPPCVKPRAVPCERRHLRFPYFAHFSATEGRARCLRASAAVVSGHRCLTGGNRFPSLADCNEACARKAP
ncbi:hypothetical protein V5799_003283 [Amblyomma americanum]|uniref:Uncharacterized protein n=1 Tax=Amblyomma americanum TaxID=6943 RepID=A0AAQ4D9F1_AMBAM